MHFLRIASIVGAVALVGYGMLQPIEQDPRWLLCLWAAAPLILIALRLSLPRLPQGITHSVQNLGIAICTGFLLLSLQLLRQQFVYADAIYNYVYVDEQTGQSISNVRPVIAAQRIKRGRMFDRNNQVLVDTEMVNGRARRTYPVADRFDPNAFGNVLGFFSARFSQSGLERTYSQYLSGEADTFGRLKAGLLGQQQVGNDLHLTIDERLQAASLQALGGYSGSVVVMDPRSGAILAMASNPGFDPRGLASDPGADRQSDNERIQAYWDQITSDAAGQPLLNRPTQGRYPPGSTYKTVTAIAALEHPNEGRPNEIDCPNERFTTDGAPPVVNAVQNLFTFTGDPSNLEKVFAYSCNTAFAEYAMRLGPELMTETARKFDITPPQEAAEQYKHFTDLSTASSELYVDAGFLNNRAALADTGYGQGQLLVTPLQMAMVASAVANDGVMVEPYLVEKVTRPDGGLVVAHGARAIRRAMSSETAATMRANMRAGVSYGFGKAAQQVDPNVALVGGKSGTAEHGAGRVPHAWFIAIAPVDQPRYAVAVMLENGADGAGVGAQTAGQVMAAAFNLEN